MERNVNHVTCFSELVRPPCFGTVVHGFESGKRYVRQKGKLKKEKTITNINRL